MTLSPADVSVINRLPPALADQVRTALGAEGKRTHICMLLDRTGSMWSVANDTIGGVNAFLAEQRKTPGACTFTLIQFDSEDPCEIVQDHVAIADAKDLTSSTYVPRGNTPLYDAIGKAIDKTVAAIDKLAQKPELVVFVIVTDGENNSSEEYTKETAAARIKDCETKGWQIVYLGVGIDAMASGSALGMQASTTLNVGKSAQGVTCCFAQTAVKLSSYRGTGDTRSLTYDASDRAAQDSAGAVKP